MGSPPGRPTCPHGLRFEACGTCSTCGVCGAYMGISDLGEPYVCAGIDWIWDAEDEDEPESHAYLNGNERAFCGAEPPDKGEAYEGEDTYPAGACATCYAEAQRHNESRDPEAVPVAK